MAYQWHTPRWFYVLSCSLISVLGWQVAGLGQLTPDGTLGNESSVVSPNVPVQGTPADLIEGGAQRGSALFHSFADFNVNDLQRVYFANPAGVLDIFTRVTGSNISNIYGTLGVDGMANLFLLNPNGVYFGPNARLDLRGSFLASTADSFTFGDDLVFGASDPQGAPPLLTVHITPGLQYGSQSATVTNQGTLTADQNLTLAGHRLEVGGELRAGRDIVLQGAERQLSEGTYTVGGYLFTQDLTGAGVEMVSPHPNTIVASGDVQLEAGYEGPSLHILAGGQVTGNNDITVTSGTGGSVTETLSDGAGGTQAVTVNATEQPTVDIRSGVDFANLMGTVPGNTNTSSLAVSFGEATGQSMTLDTVTNHGGAIFLHSAEDIGIRSLDTSVTVTSIDEDVVGQDGGPITAIAGRWLESLSELNSYSSAESETGTVQGGNGGAITLISGKDVVYYGDSFSSSSSSNSSSSGKVTGGNGGSILVVAGNWIDGWNWDTEASANSSEGDVIGGNSGTLFLVSGNGISSTNSNTESSSGSSSGDVIGGNSGSISVYAGSSGIQVSDFYSSSFSDSDSGNVTGGNGGNISIYTGNDIAQVLGSYIDSSTYTTSDEGTVTGGNGGNITIRAENDILMFSDSGVSTNSLSSSYSGDVFGGNGGKITLEAGHDIRYEGYTTVSSSSAASSNSGNTFGGNGGDIEHRVGHDIVFSGAGVYAYAYAVSESPPSLGDVNSGNGGSITLFANNDLSIIELYAFSFAEAGSTTTLNLATGDSGNVTLVAERGVIKGSPDISSNLLDERGGAFTFSIAENGNSGLGGYVNIDAANLIQNIDIFTTSATDRSGDIFIDGLGNTTLENLNISTSQNVEIRDPFGSNFDNGNDDEPEIISIPVGGTGQSGNFTITGVGDLTFIDSNILSTSNSVNPAGDITITSPGQITITSDSYADNPENYSEIRSEAQNQGAAGRIFLNAPEILIDQGSIISTATVLPAGVTIADPTVDYGAAGDIAIDTDILTLVNGGQILSNTLTSGDGGSVTIHADESVNLGEGVQDSIPIISVETSGAGRPGDIAITTPQFTLSETARITATATETATNTDEGGSITLSSDTMDLAGIVGIFAETQGQAPGGVLTLQPYQDHASLDVTFDAGATISASTAGSGRGGDLQVQAPQSVRLAGPGRLAVEASGTGPAGNIDIATPQFTMAEGVTLSASTSGAGQAGNITFNGQLFDLNNAQVQTNTTGSGPGGNIAITANTFTAANGGQIQSITEGTASAGNMTFTLQDGLFLSGANTGLFATTAAGSTGPGGSIIVDPPLMQLDDGAQISVSSAGTGVGGDITLTADVLSLSDASQIIAETASANGGNIILKVADLLWMRYGSLISATAGTNLGAGDGGNITITNPQGFIIGVPTENSDITANAFAGRGGNVNISTYGLFGLDYRPTLTPLSDITASSNFGFDGTVNIAIGGVDLSRLQEELATNLVDASQLVQQSYCDMGRDNEFIVTGRGGIPNNPREQLRPDGVLTDWVRLDAAGDSSGAANPSPTAAASPPDRIVEATHLVTDGEGNVRLVSDQADYRSPDYWPLPECSE
jgi:filamentous hemagglutinin family protein